jgi:hypothetical protein
MDRFDHYLIYNINKFKRKFINLYLRRCRAIVARSIICRELGNITGSTIKVLVIGSRYSSGASS